MAKIAIVGAGVAGMVSAYLLHRQGHEVTVFEADDRLGGHACTIDVELPEGRIQPVDVGFLVLNDRNYPQFEALLADLGVATQDSDMSFSVSDGGDFEYAGNGARGLFANPRHLRDRRFLRMIGEYARFNRDAKALLASDEDPSLLGWLEDGGYSAYFRDRLIVPQASAVWSTDPEQLWEFPARFLVRFFANHGMLGFTNRPQWRTVTGGSRRYVEAIADRVGAERFRTGTPVLALHRTEHGVDVVPAGGEPEGFDEAVLACHSDQARTILGAHATPLERQLLGAIPYQPSELVLHHDRKLLPRRRAAWASWNAHLLPAEERPAGAAITYWLNNLQAISSERQLLVSLNLADRIDPATVHATLPVAHPTYTPEGMAAQARHGEMSGVDRVHFAGAYWSWGFHEDGVRSAHRVADAIGAATAQGGRSVMTAASALYRGTIRHRRTGARQPGAFEHSITLALLDLDELPDLLGGLLVRRRPGVVRVRAKDLLGGTLGKEAVRELVATRTGRPAPDGPVRVLTHPRAFGLCFNPVSFFYLHDRDERVQAVVAEVTSTPWGEKRAYVLEAGEDSSVIRGEHAKQLHVSPFQPMDRRHVWAATTPGPSLSVHIANHADDGSSDFDATLDLRREPLTRGALGRAAARHPGGSLRTLGLIYGHAVGLKLRGARHFQHPAARAEA